MSSNPFRRAGDGTDSAHLPDSYQPPAAPASRPPPKTTFRANAPSQLALSSRPSASPQPSSKPSGHAKVVKKVRVLSPPPLTPDSPEWPFHAPPGAAANSGYAETDPFDQPTSGEQLSGKMEELEEGQREEGAVLRAANSGSGNMNVDSFRRLLMTGNAAEDVPVENATSTPATAFANAAAGVETAAAAALDGVRMAAGSEEDDVDDSSDSSLDAPTSPEKKAVARPAPPRPPPPPTSRRGRSAKTGMKDEPAETESRDTSSPGSSRRLPPTPPARSSMDDDAELSFDRDATGKTSPEADAPQQTSAAKKRVPAPPPRRGHARTDTKTSIPNHAAVSPKPVDEDAQLASPPESSRRGPNAPAPPPPRRQNTPSRPSSQLPASTSSVTPPTTSHFDSRPPGDNTARPGPRPLPAPHSSSQGGSSGDKSRGEAQKQGHGAVPPPPPPRQQRARGDSRTSMDSISKAKEEIAETATDLGKGADILADLDALQREVDALRGKMG